MVLGLCERRSDIATHECLLLSQNMPYSLVMLACMSCSCSTRLLHICVVNVEHDSAKMASREPLDGLLRLFDICIVRDKGTCRRDAGENSPWTLQVFFCHLSFNKLILHTVYNRKRRIRVAEISHI